MKRHKQKPKKKVDLLSPETLKLASKIQKELQVEDLPILKALADCTRLTGEDMQTRVNI